MNFYQIKTVLMGFVMPLWCLMFNIIDLYSVQHWSFSHNYDECFDLNTFNIFLGIHWQRGRYQMIWSTGIIQYTPCSRGSALALRMHWQSRQLKDILSCAHGSWIPLRCSIFKFNIDNLKNMQILHKCAELTVAKVMTCDIATLILGCEPSMHGLQEC